MPVQKEKPAVLPDSSLGNSFTTEGTENTELAGYFAQAAGAMMKIAAHFAGQPFPLPSVPSVPSVVKNEPSYGVSVFEACQEFLVSRARKGVSEKYYRQLKSVLESFCEGRARVALEDIEARDVESWLDRDEWSVRTRHNNLATLRLLLGWSMRRDWLRRDVTSGIELGETVAKAICIHSPPEVQTVLETARVIDLGVMRLLAIRYFAGIRSAEAHRLREENILLAHGVIEIPATKAKTKRRRIVRITPNLRAWLDLGGALIATADKTVRRVIHQSGVTWAHNVTRHTWESYSVALHENRAKVAKEAGHSEAVQIANYDAVALPADAAVFFKIVPEPMPRDIALKRWGGVRRGKRQAEALPQSKHDCHLPTA